MTEPALPLRFGGGRYHERPPLPRLSFDPSSLTMPLAELDQVTAPVARRLAAFGLETVGDLIEHFPRRYEDFRDRKQIRDLKVGEEATVRAVVERVRAERTARRRVDIVKALVRDDTGAVEAVWFNQRYLAKVLDEGMRVSLRGTYRPQSGRASFVVKSHEILEEEEGDTVHTEGIVPVYPASEQVSARLLRALLRAVRPAMRRLPDPLPAGLRAQQSLPARADAVLAVHLPRDLDEATVARQRLILEELLLMQLGLLRHKHEQQARAQAPAFPPPGELSRAFLDGLPFELTTHQLAALDELEADLTQERPMRRLLQGDVGSGKTVVALHCLARAAEAGLQGALMAPTETLAAQHADTAARLLGGLVPSELLTASLTASQRRDALERIAGGATRLVIGTHALIQEDVAFERLGLLVVDEQHRFGVEQRDALVRRAEHRGHAPHVLHMTATPIPRTLALTVYGDLDVTVIAGAPAGRQPVVTRLVEEAQREVGYEFVRKQLAKGRQVYVVCPAIEESESIAAATAVAEAERLQAGPFRDAKVAVVHGQLKAARPRRRHGVLQARRRGGARVHEPHRGGHRRAQRHRDDRRGRRALRPCPAAPAARQGGEEHGEELLPALLPSRDRRGAGPARGPVGDDGRLRAGGPRPGDPWRGPGDGRASGGRVGPEARPPGARPGGAAARPRAGRRHPGRRPPACRRRPTRRCATRWAPPSATSSPGCSRPIGARPRPPVRRPARPRILQPCAAPSSSRPTPTRTSTRSPRWWRPASSTPRRRCAWAAP